MFACNTGYGRGWCYNSLGTTGGHQVSAQTSTETYVALITTRYIFSVMFSPTIMLLIGGFTIAAALSKTAIDRILITKVLSMAGTRPSTVLLAFMGVACFASMWIR